MITPRQGPTLYASLPKADDGYRVTHDWQETQSGMRAQIVPLLRRELEDSGLSVGFIAHFEGDGTARMLLAEICESNSVYFDEKKALDDHAQLIKSK
jgi:hypothetical protein